MGNKQYKTSIGGQALYEGVMMKGPHSYSVALRTRDGVIETVVKPTNSIRDRIPVLGLPFVRGAINMYENLSLGYKTLAYSFEKAGFEEEEPTKFELWLTKKMGRSITDIVIWVGVLLGVLLAVGLFMLLPAVGASLTMRAFPTWGSTGRTLLEGCIKTAVFILYLAAVSRMGDIRRTFEYHGAEHKTIAAYESDLELTVDNVRTMSRFHPRCGTSFLFIVLIVSVLVFSLPIVPWNNVLARMAVKLLLLPLVVSVSYELIRLAGRHDGFITRVISAPGLLLQRLTTFEPNDEQLEVAIESLLPVLTGNREEDKW